MNERPCRPRKRLIDEYPALSRGFKKEKHGKGNTLFKIKIKEMDKEEGNKEFNWKVLALKLKMKYDAGWKNCISHTSFL